MRFQLKDYFKTRYLTWIILVLIALFACSIVWLNFHSELWYDHDIYPDAYLARLMSEQKTLFPDNWIFGNRLFIIGTPVISAILYTFIHDSVYSMALASSVMMVLVLLSFAWSIRPWAKKNTVLAAGILCLIGGVVLGIRASSFIAGLQILYTMSSYYACYLIVILLSLGVFLRLKDSIRVSPFMIGLCLSLSFATGLHSVRELLLLIIPLAFVEFWDICIVWRNERHLGRSLFKERKKVMFVCGMFFMNLSGIITSGFIPAQRVPIIETGFVSSFSQLGYKLADTSLDMLRITGLAFPERGIKCLPLFFAALIIVSLIVCSILQIISKKDNGALATFLKFSIISVLGVWAAGILVLKARPLYYFIHYLTATLSVVYLLVKWKDKTCETFVLLGLIVFSSISYVYNFATDFLDYRHNSSKARTIADGLVAQGDVDCIYDVYDQKPIYAAYSHDRILSSTIFFDFDMTDGYLFSTNSSLITKEMQKDAYFGKTLVSMSKSHYHQMMQHATPAYIDKFNRSMTLEREDNVGDFSYMLFRPLDKVIGPPKY